MGNDRPDDVLTAASPIEAAVGARRGPDADRPGAMARDVLVLTGLVVLSAALYLPGLGFYSDDWEFMALLHQTSGHSLAGLYQALQVTGMGTRPLQGVFLSILYTLFGTQPLGYHIANLLVLVAIVALFYFCLRGLGLPRIIAFSVPLVFAMLPHYSTNRVWIASFQAPLSILFFLVSLYADVRFIRMAGPARWVWKLTGSLALIASVLSYEVTALLFLLNPVLLWYASRSAAGPEAGAPWRTHLRWPGVVLVANVLALVLAVGYKATTTSRVALLDGLIWRIRYTAEGATSVAFGSYGVMLPVRILRAVRDHFDPAVIAVSILVGLLVWLYITRSFDRESPRSLSPARWLRIIAAGFLAFGAGYGVALVTFEIGFDTTGMNNRTAQGAALGVATVFVATIGTIAAAVSAARGWRIIRGSVAVLAASGCLLVNTIAAQWVSAARQQEAVIDAVRRHAGALAPDAVLLLDGICPYVGPGVVFETNWDVTGMLYHVTQDASITGDVVKPNTEVNESGVHTILYDDVVNVYPFGEHLMVLHVATGSIHRLGSYEAARGYFAEMTDAGRSCPPGVEGYGVRVF